MQKTNLQTVHQGKPLQVLSCFKVTLMNVYFYFTASSLFQATKAGCVCMADGTFEEEISPRDGGQCAWEAECLWADGAGQVPL